MQVLTAEKFEQIKQFVFEHGRLLERQIFDYYFGRGTQLACVNASMAYQNPDGGFGNGLEPDLKCPESSAIGAETALFLMDLLDFYDPAVMEMLLRWILMRQTEAGIIPHPDGAMMTYPHQPWWENSDDQRVLALAGYYKKMLLVHEPFMTKVRDYYEGLPLPAADDYYAYPYFIYLKYCGETQIDKEKLETMLSNLPTLFEAHADHFPLFERGWYHAIDLLPSKVVEAEAEKFINAIDERGAVTTAYPDLPWWDVPWTVDGLVLMKKNDLLEIAS